MSSLPAAGKPPLRALSAAVLAALTLLSQSPLHAADASATTVSAPREFSIAAGPLSRVLGEFASAAGVALSFDAAALSAKQSPGLQGRYSVDEGFAALLAGTGLQAVNKGTGSYVLRAVSGEQGSVVLAPVSVTAALLGESAWGEVDGYLAHRSATATKTDLPLTETPLSVSVVSRAQIVDTGAASLDSALNYAAGVRTFLWGNSTRLDGPEVRGAEPSVYLDGLNESIGYWTSTVRAEPYMLERIEVLRGPASMLYGQGSSAGIVNQVSKRPLPEQQAEVGIRFGSHDLAQIQADATGALNDSGTLLYRVVALGRDSETQVDYLDDDRQLLAPSLTWRPSEDTEWTFRLRWQKDRAGGDSGGVYPWEGTVLSNPNGRIPSDRFTGEPQADNFNADHLAFGWAFEHRFDSDWLFRQNLRVIDNDVDYAAIDASAPYIDAEQRVLERYGYFWQQDTRLMLADQNLEGIVKTGALEHRVLVGFDLMDYSQSGKSADDSPISEGGTLAPIDIYSPVYDASYRIPAYTDDPDSDIDQQGVYIQDLMTIGGWQITAGFRHDRVRNAEQGGETQNDNANTKRLAVGYRLPGGFFPYVSYSESFQPQIGRTISGARFDPLRGEQREVGLKYEPESGAFRASLAAYELREDKRIEYGPLGPESQVGETENRGADFELVGVVGPGVELNFTYSYIDIDEQLMATPRNRATLWANYHFAIAGLDNFAVGAGVRYSSAFTDGSGTPETPSATVGDLLLAWDGDLWRFALNVNNVTDKEYFGTCYSWGTCSYGEEREVVGSVTRRF